MTIASEITKLNTNLTNAYTAVSDKGGTLPQAQNMDNLATAISSIPSGGSGGKYQLLQRISDDSNNEIGTVSGFFTDSNDVEYAVVCLDAQYRLLQGKWSSATGAVTNMPNYPNQTVWSAKETATFNTRKILDWCEANSYASTSCTHCRSKSFTIDNTVYYGQLPNIVELIDIFKRREGINSKDTSSSSYSSLIIPKSRTTWSSSQLGPSNAWAAWYDGRVYYPDKTANYFVIPVLEIPNQ